MKTNRINYFYLIVILGIVTFSTGMAQVMSVKYDLYSMCENKKLEVFNRNITTFTDKDKRGIRFSKNENDGVAWLSGVEFTNGTIDIDIRGRDEYQQSFVGIAFHGINNTTFDAIYFRPFNFLSSDPARKIHAVQYVSQPDYPWQVLREKFSGKYEKAVIPASNGNEWFHAKIVISFPLVTVFFNGSKVQSLNVEKLNKRTSGKIGLWVGNNSDGDFANMVVTPQD